jgi:hypothetical protein
MKTYFEVRQQYPPVFCTEWDIACSLVRRVQKTVSEIKVELVVRQEVFGQPVDGMTSPLYGPAAVLRITLPGITLFDSAYRPFPPVDHYLLPT